MDRDTTATPRLNRTPSDKNRLSAIEKRVGLNRKKGQGHPATSECCYSTDESEFLIAIEAFKCSTGKRFPSWTEALRVLVALGWKRDRG